VTSKDASLEAFLLSTPECTHQFPDDWNWWPPIAPCCGKMGGRPRGPACYPLSGSVAQSPKNDGGQLPGNSGRTCPRQAPRPQQHLHRRRGRRSRQSSSSIVVGGEERGTRAGAAFKQVGTEGNFSGRKLGATAIVPSGRGSGLTRQASRP
jgi:hypothetical protein